MTSVASRRRRPLPCKLHQVTRPRIEQDRAKKINQDTVTGTEHDWAKYREKLADDTSSEKRMARLLSVFFMQLKLELELDRPWLWG
ncbi:hypothetical protein C2U63_01050 [Burkholderia pseudomallei]|nr:hypothetical protein C2U63_01050 [Burkholderia pseudomallei]